MRFKNFDKDSQHSRPEAGEDYAGDSAGDYALTGDNICIKPPKGSDGVYLFSLKHFLRKDPEKNIKLAKEFLKERPRSSSDMLDYDDQAIITLYVCYKKLSIIQDNPEAEVCFSDRVWRKHTIGLMYLKAKLENKPGNLEELFDYISKQINPKQGGDVCFRRFIQA